MGKLNLELEPGATVAVTGPPGYGKSTLIDLLCGLRHPDAGHVELDGIDLREIRPDSLRDHLAVARSIEIFRGSIGENVHLNRPSISNLDVRESLEAVGIARRDPQVARGPQYDAANQRGATDDQPGIRLMVSRHRRPAAATAHRRDPRRAARSDTQGRAGQLDPSSAPGRCSSSRTAARFSRHAVAWSRWVMGMTGEGGWLARSSEQKMVELPSAVHSITE